MKRYSNKVDKRSRKTMVRFLEEHFRYDTANGWNHSTSYAHNMKIYNLGLSPEQRDKLLDLLECDGAYDEVNTLCDNFNRSHAFKWQAAFNGRSGGYLVLYQGGVKELEYKSYCTVCGQRNYRRVEETGYRCGRCGSEARKNYEEPVIQSFVYPAKGTDMYEDFEEWSLEDLRTRVTLVQEFDRLADNIVDLAAHMAEHYTVEEEEFFIPATRKIAVAM